MCWHVWQFRRDGHLDIPLGVVVVSYFILARTRYSLRFFWSTVGNAFWKCMAQAPSDFNILFKVVAQHGIDGGLTRVILL